MIPKIDRSCGVCVKDHEKIPMSDLLFGKLLALCIQP